MHEWDNIKGIEGEKIVALQSFNQSIIHLNKRIKNKVWLSC